MNSILFIEFNQKNYMHIHDLPLPLREKMIYYAHPKMNDELKRAIKVTACHYYLKSIYNKWQNDFDNLTCLFLGKILLLVCYQPKNKMNLLMV